MVINAAEVMFLKAQGKFSVYSQDKSWEMRMREARNQ